MTRGMLPGKCASRRLGVRISLARARPRRDASAAGERSDQSPADPAEACRSGLPGAAPSAFGEDLGSSARSTAAAWAAAADAVEASGPPRRCLRQASQRVWAWLLLGLLLAPARAGCGTFASGGGSGECTGSCVTTRTTPPLCRGCKEAWLRWGRRVRQRRQPRHLTPSRLIPFTVSGTTRGWPDAARLVCRLSRVLRARTSVKTRSRSARC